MKLLRGLYFLFIVTIPFPVVSYSYLQLPYFTGGLLIFFFSIYAMKNRIVIDKSINLLFIAIILSIIGVLIGDFTEIMVYKPGVDFNAPLLSAAIIDINFIIQNIKMLFFIFIFIAILNMSRGMTAWVSTVGIYSKVGLFISVLGLIELVFKFFSIDFFSYIRNFSEYKIIDSMDRLLGLYSEPSMYAFYLLSVMGVSLCYSQVIDKKIGFLIFFLSTLVGLFTGSLTFFMGFIFFIGLYLNLYFKSYWVIILTFATLIFIIIVGIGLNDKLNYINELFSSGELVKEDEISNSVLNRFNSIKHGVSVFTLSPFTGVGFGMNSSLSLLVLLLSNVGLIGSILFSIFLMKGLRFDIRNGNKVINISIFSTYLTLLFVAILSFSFTTFALLHFWIILALAKNLNYYYKLP